MFFKGMWIHLNVYLYLLRHLFRGFDCVNHHQVNFPLQGFIIHLLLPLGERDRASYYFIGITSCLIGYILQGYKHFDNTSIIAFQKVYNYDAQPSLEMILHLVYIEVEFNIFYFQRSKTSFKHTTSLIYRLKTDTYNITSMSPASMFTPEILPIKRAADAMYNALPSAFKVTQNGMTKRLTRLSILFFTSHDINISGIATALYEIAKCI